jgi:hypothetical protein
MASGDIDAYVHSQRPDLSATVTSSTLSTLKSKGKLERTAGGRYRLAGEVVGPSKESLQININGIEKLVKSLPPKEAAASEDTLNEDLKLLDAALDALAQIEGVVKRNREVLRQVEALRRMLGVKS